ncbi:Hypothetical protein A7982_06357 [Minicystis rosea]|nr:Hypothetical protein A7982_06357 [Minicystis rosea]
MSNCLSRALARAALRREHPRFHRALPATGARYGRCEAPFSPRRRHSRHRFEDA